MSARPLIAMLVVLCACASHAPPPQKTVIEEHPPSPAQVAAAKEQADRAAEQARAAQAAAQEAAEKAKAAADAQAAAAAAEAHAKQEADALAASQQSAAQQAQTLQQKQAAASGSSDPYVEKLFGPGTFKPDVQPLPADPKSYAPLHGFTAMDVPADNPLTPEKAALGRQLFFDQRLSGDGAHSCYGCHVCEHGLTDGVALNKGAFDKPLTRSSPTLWNIGFHWALYWDGRAPSLEKQALAAWKGANMGADPDKVVAHLNAISGYSAQFQSVFHGAATPDNVCMALAAFMRTIVGGHTSWDRWQAGDQSAVSESAKRGWDVFQKSGCVQCHAGVLFTDLQFHNVGIGMDAATPDIGRAKVTNADADTGAFKTPTLRDVARTAPYFHDGSVPTLEQAVDQMLAGGRPNKHLSTDKLKPVQLPAPERADLIAFLKSLDERCDLTAPPLPPEK